MAHFTFFRPIFVVFLYENIDIHIKPLDSSIHSEFEKKKSIEQSNCFA